MTVSQSLHLQFLIPVLELRHETDAILKHVRDAVFPLMFDANCLDSNGLYVVVVILGSNRIVQIFIQGTKNCSIELWNIFWMKNRYN